MGVNGPTGGSEQPSELVVVLPVRNSDDRTAGRMARRTEERWVLLYPQQGAAVVPHQDDYTEGGVVTVVGLGDDEAHREKGYDTDLDIQQHHPAGQGEVDHHDTVGGVDNGHFVGPFGGVVPSLNCIVLVPPTFGSSRCRIHDDPVVVVGTTDPRDGRTVHRGARTGGSVGVVCSSTLEAHRIDVVDGPHRGLEVVGPDNCVHVGDGLVTAKVVDDQYGTALEDVEATKRPTCRRRNHTASRTVRDGVGTENDHPYDGHYSYQKESDDDPVHPSRHDGDCGYPSLPWDQTPQTDVGGLPTGERPHVCYFGLTSWGRRRCWWWWLQ